MRIESIILSLLLHGGVLALMLFWPGDTPVDLQRQSYQVSLVMGAPGGEELPSPVLGARPEKTPDPQPERGADLPDAQPDAAPELPALPEMPPVPDAQPDLPAPVELPDRTPAAVPIPSEPEEPKPQKKPEPDKKNGETEPKKEAPRPDPPKEPKKTEPKRETPKKEAPKPAPPPREQKKPRRSALEDALADVRRETSRGGKQNSSSAARALEELARETGSGGVGGGGGSGSGPGGGGIYDVYVGQVILAVQPNWSMPTYSRENLVAGVRIRLAPDGGVLDCRIEQSSGRPDFDASAVNAVLRTKKLPPPPTPAQQDLLINFNAQQLAGR